MTQLTVKREIGMLKLLKRTLMLFLRILFPFEQEEKNGREETEDGEMETLQKWHPKQDQQRQRHLQEGQGNGHQNEDIGGRPRKRVWSAAPKHLDRDEPKFLSENSLIESYPPRYNLKKRLPSNREPLVVIRNSSRNDIDNHLRQRPTELGGLLLGYVYVDKRGENMRAIEVVRSVPSHPLKSTAVSLEFSPEVWSLANKLLEDDMRVVGWYHSHPNLGAFFSGTDKYTQKNIFGHPFSLGLVIDPIRGEEEWHLGKDSYNLHPNQIIYAMPSECI